MKTNLKRNDPWKTRIAYDIRNADTGELIGNVKRWAEGKTWDAFALDPKTGRFVRVSKDVPSRSRAVSDVVWAAENGIFVECDA